MFNILLYVISVNVHVLFHFASQDGLNDEVQCVIGYVKLFLIVNINCFKVLTRNNVRPCRVKLKRLIIENPIETGKGNNDNLSKFLLLNKKKPRHILDKIPHNCFPGFNCSVDHSLTNLRAYPDCSMEYPRPIFISNSYANKVDLCHLRTRTQYSYDAKLRRYHSFFNVHKRRKHFKTSMKKKLYPSLVFRFAELLELNPDPYFSGTYDWYYTGGNLEVVNDQNVLHVIGDDLDTLAVSEISSYGDQQLKPRLTKKVNEYENENQEIFEIQTIQSTAARTYFSARQKHAISMYAYEEDNLEYNFSLTQENVPYISSTNDPQNLNSFVTSDLEKRVLLWDVHKSTSVPKQILFSSSSDENAEKDKNWNCIRYFNRDTYAFTGLQEFTLLDTRVPYDESTHKFGNVKNGYENCERISIMSVSTYENLVYIGTTHKMFAIDVRYLGQEVENKHIIIRWIHQMDMSPFILRTYQRENYELIAATSPISGDVRYFENLNDVESLQFISPSLPYMPASLLDGYNSTRLLGNCLDYTRYVKSRIEFCTTGMQFFKQNDNLFMLWSNSKGDVFSQQITFSNKDGNPPSAVENARVMEKWERKGMKFVEKLNLPLTVTDIKDLSGISQVFRCKRLEDHMEEKMEEPKKTERQQKWKKPIQHLYEYKDALAANILSIWDIDGDKPCINTEVATEELNIDSRIEEWLNITPVEEPAMVSVADISFLSNTQNTVTDLSQTLKSSKAKRRSSRKSTYVQGF